MVKPSDYRPLWLTLNSLEQLKTHWRRLVFQTGSAHFHQKLACLVFVPIQTLPLVMHFDFNNVNNDFFFYFGQKQVMEICLTLAECTKGSQREMNMLTMFMLLCDLQK